MGMSAQAGNAGGYNSTQQPGIPGASQPQRYAATQQSESGYNTYGGGGGSGYQPGNSQYSQSGRPQNDRTRDTHAIIEQGKRFVHQQHKQDKREKDKALKIAAKSKNAKDKKVDEE